MRIRETDSKEMLTTHTGLLELVQITPTPIKTRPIFTTSTFNYRYTPPKS
jgi:hypothetical protein